MKSNLRTGTKFRKAALVVANESEDNYDFVSKVVEAAEVLENSWARTSYIEPYAQYFYVIVSGVKFLGAKWIPIWQTPFLVLEISTDRHSNSKRTSQRAFFGQPQTYTCQEEMRKQCWKRNWSWKLGCALDTQLSEKKFYYQNTIRQLTAVTTRTCPGHWSLGSRRKH